MKLKERSIVGASAGASGAAITALFSTLCCVAPAVLAVFGVGAFTAAVALEPYRPYLLGIAYVALGFAFWRTYWPRRSESGAACAPRAGRLSVILLWASAALVTFSTLGPFFLG